MVLYRYSNRNRDRSACCDLVQVLNRIRDDADWTGKVDEHMSSVTTFMDEIRKSIGQILQRLPPVPVASGSALPLTDFGRSISDDLSAKKWVKQIAPALVSKVSDLTEYEVYEFCVKFVKNEFKPNEEQEARLRKVAYDRGIDREKVLEVLTVELRDELLERLNLTQKTIENE